MKQTSLFETVDALPQGFEYRPEFLSPEEEAHLIEKIRSLPLKEAAYKEFVARRRIVSYGGRYDFSAQELLPAGPIPEFLHPLRERVARWVELPANSFNHALVTEYAPGTQLGWHRDVPDFEVVVGVSLAGACRMRLRPYPTRPNKREGVRTLDVQPRSAYVMRNSARWKWQHAISPTKELRYSITFRTLASNRSIEGLHPS
jgi:alkylated DNA repair dioxygenase AlkB